MITDFLKSMFPVDPNPPPGVPYIWCGVWGVGCGVWGAFSVKRQLRAYRLILLTDNLPTDNLPTDN